MTILEFVGQSRVLNAPEKWDRGKLPCGALPVLDHEWEGMPVMTSWWKPEPAELERLKAGEFIQFSLLGHRHPPVAIAVSKVDAVIEREPGPARDVSVPLARAMMAQRFREDPEFRRVYRDHVAMCIDDTLAPSSLTPTKNERDELADKILTLLFDA